MNTYKQGERDGVRADAADSSWAVSLAVKVVLGLAAAAWLAWSVAP